VRASRVACSSSVVGSVQLERWAESGVQVRAQAPGSQASARHAGWRGAAPTEDRRRCGKDGLIATNRY
jgi:hypothetical protein